MSWPFRRNISYILMLNSGLGPVQKTALEDLHVLLNPGNVWL